MYKALLSISISQAIPVDAHAVFLDHFLCQFVSVIITDQKHAKRCIVVNGLKSGGHINYLLYVLVEMNVPLL